MKKRIVAAALAMALGAGAVVGCSSQPQKEDVNADVPPGAPPMPSSFAPHCAHSVANRSFSAPHSGHVWSRFATEGLKHMRLSFLNHAGAACIEVARPLFS